MKLGQLRVFGFGGFELELELLSFGPLRTNFLEPMDLPKIRKQGIDLLSQLQVAGRSKDVRGGRCDGGKGGRVVKAYDAFLIHWGGFSQRCFILTGLHPVAHGTKVRLN
jgi:hypothetical protein